MRVDIRKLDQLMNIVGELAIVRGALGRVFERVRAMAIALLPRHYNACIGVSSAGSARCKAPFSKCAWCRSAKYSTGSLGLFRQISRELDKEIRLVITGADTEIDKLIVEELSDPLMHMIRNAIDHGIEPADERTRVGKPTAGTIALNAYQRATT